MSLGEFLRARRARVRPVDVGLPDGASRRRTPGLRREELAAIAGVSVDYYARLEQGKETRPSPSVLDALARALGLDDEEKAHLTPQGGLLCEIGRGREQLEDAYPQLPLLWLDTEDSDGEVFWIAASDL